MPRRDDFSKATIESLAKRVGLRCSNPDCRQLTHGPHSDDAKAVNVGVAAHITAASKGGPRYDESLWPEERRSAVNGIWLCQKCAKLIDNDPERYSVELVREWKAEAERHADDEVVGRAPGDRRSSAAPSLGALHQLPPPPADFVGREAELRELTEAGASGVTILGLRGAGGIGKTVLALKLAERLTKDYPDAQFYLDLRGAHEQEPLSPEEAMRHVIRGWRPAAKLPDNSAELAGLYRANLNGKRALLLMDNAKDEQQVQPLIPPEGSFLLVTSRQRFALPGLKALNLDVLEPKDAKALLLSICPRLGDTADELAELCGHYALALRVSASTLATREDLTPDGYLQRLRESKAFLDHPAPDYHRSCTASIALTYELLSEQLKQRWRLLAVFEGSFDLAAATAVWAIDQDPASLDMGRLFEYSLVECNPTNQRYHLHDLVRQVADERLGPE